MMSEVCSEIPTWLKVFILCWMALLVVFAWRS